MAERQFTGQIYFAEDPDDDPRVQCFIELRDDHGEPFGNGFGETFEQAFAEAFIQAGWKMSSGQSPREEAKRDREIREELGLSRKPSS